MSTEGEEFVLEKFGLIIEYAKQWYLNESKLTKNIKYKSHLQASVYERAFSLDDKYDSILNVLLKYPASSTQDVCIHLNPNMDDNGYRRILRQVKMLLKLGLIEETLPDAKYIGNMGKNTIPYQLTLAGIIYIITNFGSNLFFSSDPLKHLLCNYNYPYNSLFHHFLYPNFSKETVLSDKELRFNFLIYLRRICKIIQKEMIFYYSLAHLDLASSNLIDNKYVPNHLFYWSKSKTGIKNTNEQITNALRNYLLKEFGWAWIKNAAITIDYDNNRIEIKDQDNNYAMVNISTSTMTVNLRYKGITYSDLFKMHIDNQTISISGKGHIAKEVLDLGFLFSCQSELLSLLFSLQSHSVKNKKYRKILSKDPKYRNSIDMMINLLSIKDP